MTPTLTELCEPFFQEVCAVIRSGEFKGGGDVWSVRDRLMGRLNELRSRAGEGSADLAREYDRIEPVLAFFADDVIFASPLPYARQWVGDKLLASDPRINVKTGAEEFFNQLKAALAEPSTAAAERLTVFYTCLVLGFGGIHRDNAGELRGFAEQVVRRLDSHVSAQRGEDRVCPTAYVLDERVLFTPVRERVLVIGVLFAALMVAVVIAWYGSYKSANDLVENTLGVIIQRAETRAPTP